MTKKSILIKKQAPLEPTRKELEDAAEDARTITPQSSVVQHAIVGMITARRLYMAYRSMLDNELAHGWEVDNLPLVVQTIEMSAQERAMINHTALDIQRDIFQCIIPTLDIIARQEHEDSRVLAAQNKEKEANDISSTSDPGAVLPRTDPGEAPGLDGLPDGAGSDPVKQAGEHSQGSGGEEGQAGA